MCGFPVRLLTLSRRAFEKISPGNVWSFVRKNNFIEENKTLAQQFHPENKPQTKQLKEKNSIDSPPPKEYGSNSLLGC